MDLLEGVTVRIEQSLGAKVPLANSWESAPQSVVDELDVHWPSHGDSQSAAAISEEHDVVRLVTFDHGADRGGTIRYITPNRVWTFTVPRGGGDVVVHPPVGLPLDGLPFLTDLLGGGLHTDNQAELRLTLTQALPLTNPCPDGPSASLGDVWVRYDDHGKASSYHSNVTWSSGRCLACGTDACRARLATVSASRLSKTISIKCPSEVGVVKHRLSGLDYYHLFGGRAPCPRPEATWHPPTLMTGLPWGPEPRPLAGLGASDGKKSSDNRPPHEDSLTVIQCNLDKRGRRALGWVLSMAEEHKANAVCLQEIENVSWPTYALSAMGWNFYRHGKVGILTRRATTERLSGFTAGE